jgi:DNA-binding transcriptional ArsR family regulator
MEEMAAIFNALSDPTRLRIFDILRRRCWELDEADGAEAASGPTVGAIVAEVHVSGATVSHHLKELRQAGLIRTERCGRTIMCCANDNVAREAADWLAATTAAECGDCY